MRNGENERRKGETALIRRMADGKNKVRRMMEATERGTKKNYN